jgi:hypothetical protein
VNIEELFRRTAAFRKATNLVLAKVETSSARIITVEESYNQIGGLSVKQDDLFRQALRCIQSELFRAAYVMSWAAFVDFFHNKLAEDNLVKLKAVRPNWKLSDITDLREQSDFQLIEAAAEMHFISKTEKKALQGLLNSRNECAHPEDYYPGLNEALGYLSALISRVKTLKSRTL